jgi:predicted ATPase/DNA-binding NarL/FixJ family response regulator
MGTQHHLRDLPKPLTSFIGRERELLEVTRLLDSTRLLTLIGVGGCGKTRLALQLAIEQTDAYEDGVCWVDLASLSEPALVTQSVAQALGLREASHESLLETITNYLQAKQFLLVLDNCEHLLVTCRKLGEALLRACPDLKVLATSREPLTVVGELCWLVPALSLPDVTHLPRQDRILLADVERYDAVHLFVERAKSVLTTFTLTSQNQMAVAQVCQRLDGMPLAIELAAARVNVLAVQQIADRLDDRFALLTGGNRTALIPRHQTLRATMDWSYDLLSEPERILFRRLAVFAGGFGLEAAEAICTGNGIQQNEGLDLLSCLVDKSLVAADTQRNTEARYRLLETVRQYASDKLLERGETVAIRERHLDFFLVFAVAVESGLKGPEQVSWLKRLDTEFDNLRAAMNWALESGQAQSGLRMATALWIWHARGYWREGLDRLERLLARPEAAERTPTRAAALNAAGFFAFELGDAKAAQAWLNESKAISLELGVKGRPYLAWSLGWLGDGMIDHDKTIARHALNESIMLSRETEDNYFLALMLRQRGILAIREGDLELAGTVSRESLALFQKIGNQWGAAVATGNLGVMYYLLEDYAAAYAHFQAALTIYRVFQDKLHIAATLIDLGGVAQLQGDYQQASAFFDEGLATCRDIGRAEDIARALSDLGIAVGQRGDRARAAAFLTEALSLNPQMGNAYGSAICLLGLAGVQRQPVRAAQLLAAAQTAFEAKGDILLPLHRVARQRIEHAARISLGDEAFAIAWAEGQALTVDQAMQLAMEAESSTAPAQPTARSEPAGQPPSLVEPLAEPLNAREIEVLRLIADGLSNHEIADRLVIALSTVKWHVSNLFGKLGVNSRTQALSRAKDLGLL